MRQKKTKHIDHIMSHPIVVHSPEDQLILRKASIAKSALEEFIRRETQLRRQTNQIISQVGGEMPLPSPLSWKVWLLRDGLVAVRYQDWRPSARIDFVLDNNELVHWVTKIPTPKGDVSTTSIRFGIGFICSVGGFVFSNLKAEVRNITIASYRYDDDRFREPEQQAIIDLRLTALGRLLQSALVPSATTTADSLGRDITREAFAKFESLLSEFESLLGTAVKEEEIQIFLKANPVLFGAFGAVEVIPKQKLGEDFITDFVLVEPLAHGPMYTLVEIEGASKKLFTRAGSPHGDLSRAQAQIVDWKVWLDDNQGYLKGKLNGFAFPRFLIVMGRGSDLNDENKKRLRALNSSQSNLIIMTYDDLFSKGKNLVVAFRHFLDGSGNKGRD